MWVKFEDFFFWRNEFSDLWGAPVVLLDVGEGMRVYTDDVFRSDEAWNNLRANFPSVHVTPVDDMLIIDDADFVRFKMTYS